MTLHLAARHGETMQVRELAPFVLYAE